MQNVLALVEILQKAQLISEDDINGFGLLTAESLKKFINGEFNAILNLDPELNLISAQIIFDLSVNL